MGKYEPLARHLASLASDDWSARFTEVEGVLGFTLPESAHKYRAWWANQHGANHSQTEGWQSAGWETREVDFDRKLVRFERSRGGVPRSMTRGSALAATKGHQWKRAEQITGISDRGELIKVALEALIQRETASYLASLGGTMPDAQAAPRRRFD